MKYSVNKRRISCCVVGRSGTSKCGPSPVMIKKEIFIFNILLGMYLLFLSPFLSLAASHDLAMDFHDGEYVQNEWKIDEHEVSARYIPHGRSPFTYVFKKGDYTTITGAGMDMQLCTTTGAARANVYVACGGIRHGFQMHTYPHDQLWKNVRHWEMPNHCLEILNKTGEIKLVITVNWDGHGTFHLLNLKMSAE
ncbi:hypothetical protein SAMN02746065_10744 [Desulfocicer vacuolatum DSM 3385]|uniref:Uncharacterized protein n=1 Tax=Desulfocicer vacuolatum DSM 3385 TaxID=1121400 RepID=A0A1W2B7S7_9BACT|nr:hypothetical protein [Desulfocicer vacuolatum]SMC68850.1 hypothetical protein SAMN02746065_10744 [Desulfocicer vacuolatum DSM 3385]